MFTESWPWFLARVPFRNDHFHAEKYRLWTCLRRSDRAFIKQGGPLQLGDKRESFSSRKGRPKSTSPSVWFRRAECAYARESYSKPVMFLAFGCTGGAPNVSMGDWRRAGALFFHDFATQKGGHKKRQPQQSMQICTSAYWTKRQFGGTQEGCYSENSEIEDFLMRYFERNRPWHVLADVYLNATVMAVSAKQLQAPD